MPFISEFLAIVFLFLQSGRSEIIKRSAFFNTNENVKLDSSAIISRQTSPGVLSCSQKCLSDPLCYVFNYGSSSASQGICELYKTSSDDLKLIREPGWLCGHLHGPRKMFKDFKFTFTNLGVVGRMGPTDSSGYKGTTLEGKVRLENGIQLWTVPLSGSYVIEAWGASGAEGRESADVSAATRAGGKGAYVKGTFNLTLGKELKIVVGQTGSRGKTGSPLPGGGGGGTFVTSSAGTPLIIAGGGGGGVAQSGNLHEGDPGQTRRNGSRAGGSNGSGGNLYEQGSSSASFECGAGGGLNGDGSGDKDEGGKGFVGGGRGGNSPTGGYGGFGGGGAAWRYPGAGGGYSGGGVVKNEKETNAGGGGSFNSGAKSEKKEGLGEGDGKVIITLSGG